MSTTNRLVFCAFVAVAATACGRNIQTHFGRPLPANEPSNATTTEQHRGCHHDIACGINQRCQAVRNMYGSEGVCVAR